MYLTEAPSIVWEAKTLVAKRRISSSEIATVPGTVDLVELLFNAVLMLVDWLVGSVSRSRGEALGAAGVFSTFGFGRKVCWAYFSSRKRSLSRATRGRRPGRERAARNETETEKPDQNADPKTNTYFESMPFADITYHVPI